MEGGFELLKVILSFGKRKKAVYGLWDFKHISLQDRVHYDHVLKINHRSERFQLKIWQHGSKLIRLWEGFVSAHSMLEDLSQI